MSSATVVLNPRLQPAPSLQTVTHTVVIVAIARVFRVCLLAFGCTITLVVVCSCPNRGSARCSRPALLHVDASVVAVCAGVT